MRAKNAKMIFKLVSKKNELVLDTLKLYLGERVEKMSGIAVYKNAKRLWTKKLTLKEKLEWSKQSV